MLKKSFAAANVKLKDEKEEVARSRLTALGCDIQTDPPLVAPDAHKLSRLVGGLLAVILNPEPVMSPRTFSALLGLLQWFMQLQRPCFAILAAVYDFAALEPQDRPRRVPFETVMELEVALCLLPLLPGVSPQYLAGYLAGCGATGRVQNT